jgi:hypothetical protein
VKNTKDKSKDLCMLMLCEYCNKRCCVMCSHKTLSAAMNFTCSSGFFVSFSIFLSMTSCWCEKLCNKVFCCNSEYFLNYYEYNYSIHTYENVILKTKNFFGIILIPLKHVEFWKKFIFIGIYDRHTSYCKVKSVSVFKMNCNVWSVINLHEFF